MLKSFKLKKCKQSIYTLCDMLHKDTNCAYFKKFVLSNERLLTLQLHKLQSLSRRNKRFFALINTGITMVANWIKEWIFGSSDEEIMDELKRADEENREFLKEQVVLSNKSLHVQQQAFKKIINQINLLHSELSSLRDIYQKTQMVAHLHNLIQDAMLLLNHYQLIDVLTKVFVDEKTINCIDFIGEDMLKDNILTIDKKLGEAQ